MVIEILGYIFVLVGGIGLGAMFVSIFVRRENKKMNEQVDWNEDETTGIRWRKF